MLVVTGSFLYSYVLAHEVGAMSGQVEHADSPQGSEMLTSSEYLLFPSHQPSHCTKS